MFYHSLYDLKFEYLATKTWMGNILYNQISACRIAFNLMSPLQIYYKLSTLSYETDHFNDSNLVITTKRLRQGHQNRINITVNFTKIVSEKQYVSLLDVS
jgi:hypothetical protein